jgi:hypothetical protein
MKVIQLKCTANKKLGAIAPIHPMAGERPQTKRPGVSTGPFRLL